MNILQRNDYWIASDVRRRSVTAGLAAFLSAASVACANATISAPASLTASTGNGAVFLTWPTVAGADTYNVYRLDDDGYKILARHVSATWYTDAFLVGTAHSYEVTACDTLGGVLEESVPSPTATGSSLSTYIGFASLNAVAYASSISLTWGAIAGATNVRVMRSTSSFGPFVVVANVTPAASGSTSYTDTSVVSNTQYYYVVQGDNSRNAGAYSNEVSATAPWSVSLPLLADAYTDQGAPTSNFGSLETLQAGGVSGAQHVTFLQFDIAAVTASAFSSQLKIYQNAGPASVLSIYGISPSGLLEDSITFNTAPVLPRTAIATLSTTTTPGYFSVDVTPYIQTQKAAGATSVTFGIASHGSTAAIFTSRDTHSANVPQLVYSPTPAAPPLAPTSLSATSGNGQVSLSWTLPGGTLSGIKVYRGTSTGTETFLASGSGTSTTYIDTTAVNGTTYYYQVSAVDAVSGEGPKSNEVTATPVQYNLVRDYTGNNPNTPTGPWSYGWEYALGESFTKYDTHNTAQQNIDGWAASTLTNIPAIVHNDTNVNVSYDSWTLPPDVVGLHPGSNHEVSVVRWKAPSTGTVTVTGAFSGLDATTTDITIVLSDSSGNLISTPYNTNHISGNPDTHTFSFTQAVTANQTLDFVVAAGSFFYNDTTGLKVGISY